MLNQLAAGLEEINVAWYADATRVFPEGTAEGEMIRGTIPTTYDPPAAPATHPARRPIVQAPPEIDRTMRCNFC